MANIENGNAAQNQATVDSNGNLSVRLPTADAQTGKVRIVSENDDGSILGTASLLSPESSDDYRLRVGTDSILDSCTFNFGSHASGQHLYRNTTMTNAWGSGGFLVTNSGNITTANTNTIVQTYRHFPIYGASPLYCEFSGAIANAIATNTTVDIGLFLASATTPYAPFDGVYFRIDNTGIFGVINYNGTESTTSPFTFTFTIGKVYKFNITINERLVEFWIDDKKYGSFENPLANGQPMQTSALPFGIRHTINAGGAGSVFNFRLSDYTISQGDWGNGLPFLESMAAAGGMGIQGQPGGTAGSTANYANSANPTAAVPTNTTAALGTGLGGQFWETDTLAVTTDGIICSYQNPAAAAGLTGKTLLIYGIKIESVVQAALTGGGYNAQWGIGVGHTAVSIATAEGNAAKAPRRVALGFQTVASGAAALVKLEVVQMTFRVPLVVNPGEFVAVFKKKIGTAPSAGTIAHTITIDSISI